MGATVLGPIDYLAVEWPGKQVTGEGFRLLMDLVDREIAVPLWTAIERSNARLVGAGRIVADDLIAALGSPDPT